MKANRNGLLDLLQTQSHFVIVSESPGENWLAPLSLRLYAIIIIFLLSEETGSGDYDGGEVEGHDRKPWSWEEAESLITRYDIINRVVLYRPCIVFVQRRELSLLLFIQMQMNYVWP